MNKFQYILFESFFNSYGIMMLFPFCLCLFLYMQVIIVYIHNFVAYFWKFNMLLIWYIVTNIHIYSLFLEYFLGA